MNTSNSAAKPSSSFTAADLIAIKARVSSTPICIGIVCRPEIADQVRKMVAANHLPSPFFEAMPIYVDADQPEPWIPFYDRHLLKAYLNRNPQKD